LSPNFFNFNFLLGDSDDSIQRIESTLPLDISSFRCPWNWSEEFGVLGIYMPNFLFFSRDSLVTVIIRHKQAVSESFAYFREPCFRPVVKSDMTDHGGPSVGGTN
jgi:hypothetical protein